MVEPAGFKVDSQDLPDLTTLYTTKVIDLFPLGGHVDFITTDGAWYLDDANGFIRIQKNFGKDTVGDLRISY